MAKNVLIGEVMVKMGVIDQDKLSEALKEQKRLREVKNENKLLGQILVEKGYIKTIDLNKTLWESYKYILVDPDEPGYIKEAIKEAAKGLVVDDGTREDIHDFFKKIDRKDIERFDDTDLAIIDRCELFNELDENLKSLLLSKFIKKNYIKSEVLFREGEYGDRFYLIMEGEVEVKVGDRIVEVLKQGDFFGELALFDNGRRSATIKAKTDVYALELIKKDFVKLLELYPVISINILKVLARRLRDANKIRLKDF